MAAGPGGAPVPSALPIPHSFPCPITREVMRDPVMTVDSGDGGGRGGGSHGGSGGRALAGGAPAQAADLMVEVCHVVAPLGSIVVAACEFAFLGDVDVGAVVTTVTGML